MEYIVVSNADLDIVVHEVNECLKVGWQLQGGISATESRSGGYTVSLFAQAMIKNDTNAP